MPSSPKAGLRAELALVACLALALRLAAAHYGLPAVYNADEPHHVNVAVSFGRGSLDPVLFKYPTLWAYVLAAAYGAWFLAWSGLGLLAGPRDFARLFAWEPAGFFLLGRLLSAAAGAAAVALVWAAARRVGGPRVGLWAAALLASSHAAAELAWSTKPDSLMLALAAAAWLLLVRGSPASGAACAGLSLSTQYTAAPLLLAPVLAAGLTPGRLAARLRGAALACAAAGAAFLAGSPYVLLRGAAFMRDISDHVTVNLRSWPVGPAALSQLGRWAGAWWPLAAGLALAGAAALARRDRRLALLLAVPPLVHALLLTRSSTGLLERYFLASAPAAAVLAAEGVEAAARAVRLPLERAWARALVLALLTLPGAWTAAAAARERLRPDTRAAAARWIEANVPAGTAIVLSEEHDNPALRPSREFVAAMLAAARERGHPKARLYELMLESHPGGGYALYRVSREALSIDTGPEHRRFAEGGRLAIPVSGGVAALRERGVSVVVLSTYGLGRITPDYKAFQEEVVRSSRLLARFAPEPGRTKGPGISVYRLEGARPTERYREEVAPPRLWGRP